MAKWFDSIAPYFLNMVRLRFESHQKKKKKVKYVITRNLNSKLNEQAYKYVRTTTNGGISKQMRNKQRNAKTNKCANKRKKHGREYT